MDKKELISIMAAIIYASYGEGGYTQAVEDARNLYAKTQESVREK